LFYPYFFNNIKLFKQIFCRDNNPAAMLKHMDSGKKKKQIAGKLMSLEISDQRD
jgi:hypothetical protein